MLVRLMAARIVKLPDKGHGFADTDYSTAEQGCCVQASSIVHQLCLVTVQSAVAWLTRKADDDIDAKSGVSVFQGQAGVLFVEQD